jgi:DNA modification methylase
MIFVADAKCRAIRKDSVDCIVTAPPYWGTGEYGGEFGREPSIEHYAFHLGAILREARGGLKDGGTLWLFLGKNQHDVVIRKLLVRGWRLQRSIIWDKGNDYEWILLFSWGSSYRHWPLDPSAFKGMTHGGDDPIWHCIDGKDSFGKFYMIPEILIGACLTISAIDEDCVVYDPMAGNGSVLRAAQDWCDCTAIGSDLCYADPEAINLDEVRSYIE